MTLRRQLSWTSFAMSLSLGGLGAGLAGCASTTSARPPAAQSATTKGSQHSCGKGAATMEAHKGDQKSCSQATGSADQQDPKGGEKSCGQSSCSS